MTTAIAVNHLTNAFFEGIGNHAVGGNGRLKVFETSEIRSKRINSFITGEV